jgi:hypothetical protein
MDSRKKKKVTKHVVVKEEESKTQIDIDVPMQDEPVLE